MGGGSRTGEIAQLAGVIREHRRELTADLRDFYSVSLYWVGSPALPVQELCDLIDDLMREPSSRLQAAVAGWDHRVTREWIALVDLYDLQHASKSKRKPKPYPRPFDKIKRRIGGKKHTHYTPEQLRALLARPRVPRTK